MTLGRTTAGINNTDCRYGERVDQVRRCVAASLSDDGVQLARISWLDPDPGTAEEETLRDPGWKFMETFDLRQCVATIGKKDCRSIVVQLFCEPNVLPTFSTLPMKWAAASEGFLKVVERLGRPNPLTLHA